MSVVILSPGTWFLQEDHFWVTVKNRTRTREEESGVGNNSATLVSLQSDAVNIMLCSRLHCTLYAPYGLCALVQHYHSVVTPHVLPASTSGMPVRRGFLILHRIGLC